jgi:hypothetical protein
MKIKTVRSLVILSALVSLASPAKGDDLKAYYEQQKAELLSSFVPPALGSEVTVVLAGGQERSGILMKLSNDAVTLMSDTGTTVDYRRMALKDESRALFFADDFSHVQALEKTRDYKEQMLLDSMAEEQANLHQGLISVTASVDKSSDKQVEEDEKDNEKTGNSTTTTTTTKTYTETQNLKITISNNTTHPDTYNLEWYFFAQAMQKTTQSDRDQKESVKPLEQKTSTHSSGSKTVTVDARKRIQQEVSSDPFIVEKVTIDRVSSDNNNSHDPRVTESGKENAGWVVLLKYQGEILDKKASARKFLEDDWLHTLRLQ